MGSFESSLTVEEKVVEVNVVLSSEDDVSAKPDSSFRSCQQPSAKTIFAE
jgi:hypothetical protein